MVNIKRNCEITRKTLNLPTELVNRVMIYASLLGVNFTSALIFLVNDGLEENGLFESMTSKQLS